MDTNVIISIDWPWLLGIFGSIFLVGWRMSGKFGRIEKTLETMSSKIGHIEKSLALLEKRVLSLELRVSSIEGFLKGRFEKIDPQ